MNITKAQAVSMAESTKGAISKEAFYRLKGLEVFRAAHAMKEEDFVSVRIDLLESIDKESHSPEWVNIVKEGKLPKGNRRPVFAVRCTDIEYTPSVQEHVILLEGEEGEYTARPATVASKFARGKLQLAVWNEGQAEETIIKADPHNVLALVPFARDYWVNSQLYYKLTSTDAGCFGLNIQQVEELVNVLSAYELDLYDWLEYARSSEPTKTPFYRYLSKPLELGKYDIERGILWKLLKDGDKLYAKYCERNGIEPVEPYVELEPVLGQYKAAVIKKVYLKVCEKAGVDDDDIQTTPAAIKKHLIALANTPKKVNIVIKNLSKLA